jgi:tetratricopeptide (TPR) repeat protein
MEQAVAIDPEFAMAYRTMAMSYGNLGYRTKRKELLQKALNLADRLSDRERYRIQADFYSRSEKTYDKAFEAFEKLLEIYPDEIGARNNLAVRYSSIGEDQKAIEHYEIAIKKYKTDLIYSYTNLASEYEDLGLFNKAKEAYEEYLNNFQDSAFIHQRLSRHYRYQGKYDLAFEEMDKAFALAPTDWGNFSVKGDIYLYIGDLKKAEEEYRKLLEKEELSANTWGMQRLSWLFALQGRFKDAIEMTKRGLKHAEEIGEKTWIQGASRGLSYLERRSGNPDRALELLNKIWESAVEDENYSDQRSVLFNMGLTYLEMKSIDEAQKTAERLKKMIEQGMNKKLIRNYYALMGEIEREKNNYSKAIEFSKKVLPLLSGTSGSHLPLAYHTGLAYYKAGDLENGDLYAKSFYMLGKIYEQQGNRGKATENYEKFLDLWKNADPGIAEVEDARKRLAGLRM